MNTKIPASLLAVAMAAASTSSNALILNIDYSYDANGFFADPARQATMEAAASYFETLITDDLTAITSGGGNSFNAVFSNPATGGTETINNFSVAADTLTIFAGGRSISALGIGGPGGYSLSGSSAFVDNATSRGETADTQGPGATDFAPWGGSITFDTGTSWYFDDDTSTDEAFSGFDFFSVALHELSHVLGIGTADSWDNLINGSNEFTGAQSTAAYGGNVPVSASQGHWDYGVNSQIDGNPQEAAMTPTVASGERKRFTDLDVAGLDDIGWDVAPVPVPAAVWLFGSGLLGLVGVARRKAA